MKRSALIKEVIIQTGQAKSAPEANRLFVQTFVDYFSQWDLQTWDTEVPAELAEKYRRSVGGPSQNVSVRFLIKDLDSLLR
jgi:hypothetical protein